MHQSIATPGLRAPGHSGKFNIYPLLKDVISPPPGSVSLLKAPAVYRGHVNTGTNKEEEKKKKTSNRHRSSWTGCKGQTSSFWFPSIKTPASTTLIGCNRHLLRKVAF